MQRQFIAIFLSLLIVFSLITVAFAESDTTSSASQTTETAESADTTPVTSETTESTDTTAAASQTTESTESTDTTSTTSQATETSEQATDTNAGATAVEEEQTVKPDRIAFVSKRTGNEDIFIVNDDGTDLVQLTDSPFRDEKPQWSPDGSKILYVNYEWKLFGSRYELWVVNVDGTNRIRLAESIDLGSKPFWSKDGSKVLYVGKVDKRSTIMVINADGSEPVALTDPKIEAVFPVWSPDNSRILYAQNKKNSGVYMMNADGSGKVKLTKSSGSYYSPTWSPDGNKVGYAFDSKALIKWFALDDGIYLVNLDGSNKVRLGLGDDLFWCPDGSAIAFTRAVKHESTSTSYSATGSRKDDVKTTYTYRTYLVSTSPKSKAKGLAESGERVYPEWSADGLKLAYINRFDVHVLESGQSKPRKYDVPFAMGTPRWSPDSKKIVCIGYEKLLSKPSLYLFNIEDGKIFKLTDGTFDFDPVWASNVK